MTAAVSEAEFRDAFSHLAVGVCLLATHDTVGRDVGLTVTSVTSVSLRPPLCLVSVRREGYLHDAVSVTDGWTVSMLDASQRDLADYAARHRYPSDTDDFTGFGGRRDPDSGLLWFPESLGAVQCRTTDLVAAGDHTLVVGEVIEVMPGTGQSPLLRLRGQYVEPWSEH